MSTTQLEIDILSHEFLDRNKDEPRNPNEIIEWLIKS